MGKPRAFIHWTQTRDHDVAGVLVIGRLILPMVVVYGILGAILLGSMIGGMTFDIIDTEHPNAGLHFFLSVLVVYLIVGATVGVIWGITAAVRAIIRANREGV